MMHVDKNANGHVVDQNVDRISREIAYLPLVGGSGLKVVHACSFFFFFGRKKMSIRHAYQWSRQNEDFSRDLEFGHTSQRSDGFEVWTCFLEVRWIFGR